jgi:hypothetical protein
VLLYRGKGSESSRNLENLGLDRSVLLSDQALAIHEDALSHHHLLLDLSDPSLMLGDASSTRLGTFAQELLGLTQSLAKLLALVIESLDLRVSLCDLLGLLETKTLQLGLSIRDHLLRGALSALVVVVLHAYIVARWGL